MNEERCCWTCEYHYRFSKDYDSECDNEKSPYFQCEVLHSDVCEEYEESGWHKEEREREKLMVNDKDLGQVEGKTYEEIEPMAVLALEDWKSCGVCGFKDYPRYREGPVCFLTYRDIKYYCDADLKSEDCPFDKAIGIITPDGHVKYFREKKG